MPGVILKMEFLHAPESDAAHIMLVLVVARAGHQYLVWFEWDHETPLHDTDLQQNLRQLPAQEESPLLLIPMLQAFALLLVSETWIVVYRDLLTLPGVRLAITRENPAPAEEEAASRRAPIWTQWARVLRSSVAQRSPHRDGVYLCREDGVINFLELNASSQKVVEYRHTVDKLPVNVDSAFAVLDVGPQKADVLAVGGDGCDGGLWYVEARVPAAKLAVHPNWTPLVDMVPCFDPISEDKSKTYVPYDRKLPRYLMGHGRGKYGAIAETRLGYPAPTFFAFNLEGIPTNNVMQVWAFGSSTESNVSIVLSMSTSTVVTSLGREDDDSDEFSLIAVDLWDGLFV